MPDVRVYLRLPLGNALHIRRSWSFTIHSRLEWSPPFSPGGVGAVSPAVGENSNPPKPPPPPYYDLMEEIKIKTAFWIHSLLFEFKLILPFFFSGLRESCVHHKREYNAICVV